MDDTITGSILQKADDVFENALDEDGWFSYVKAFFAGVLMGAVDGCFIAGLVCVVIGFISLFKKED